MKKIPLTLSLSLAVWSGLGQGFVNFYNTATTLVTAGVPGTWLVGYYYFGLLTAPVGTTDPSNFRFTGLYATNMAAAGRFFGGANVLVPEWPAGASEAFMVAGWSASFGHDWNQAWLSGEFPDHAGAFGVSAIGTSVPGNLFGGATGIQTGWNLVDIPFSIPEPSVTAMVVLGAAMVIYRRSTVENRGPRVFTVPNWIAAPAAASSSGLDPVAHRRGTGGFFRSAGHSGFRWSG